MRNGGRGGSVLILKLTQSCYNFTMKRSLMDIIVCPVCKGDLTLTVAAEEGDEIVTGSLHCGKCNVDYPIEESIPNLLPPEND